MITDLLEDAVPAERGLVAVGLGSGAFFGGGDGKRAGDGAVVGDDVEALSGYGDAEVHRIRLRLR